MLRTLMAVLLILSPIHLFADEGLRRVQVSWLKDLKELLQEIEKKEDALLTEEKEFRLRFQLFEKAYADSRYDCFFGGWPSKAVQSGGKKLCINPLRGNESYVQGSCSSSEMQCNPVLFGKNICVPFASKSDKNNSYSNCEKKFEKTPASDYSFLDDLTREEVQSLREISQLAAESCLKSQTAICQKILKRLPTGLRSIDDLEKSISLKKMLQTKVERPVTKSEENCEEATVFNKIDKELKKNSYEWMREKFLKSPFCDPYKVLSDDSVSPPAPLVAALNKDLKFFDQRNLKMDFLSPMLDRLIEKYKIENDANLKIHLEGVVHSKNEDDRRLHMARFKTLFNQLFINKSNYDGLKEIALDGLIGANIFEENDEGEAVCPFVSEDAFNKAIQGYEAVKAKHGNSITKKNQLTIVDYTKPSNSRRLFVFDLETGDVLQNTWVAHGGGGGASGSDGIGGSPKVSNTSGSLMSSDGFILATKASSGSLYGPNVLLKGVDRNNSNLTSRAVVVHGWSSPMSEYNQGVSDYNGDEYGPRFDIVQKVKTLDTKATSYREMEKRIFQLQGATSAPPYLAATEGCLGVPLNNVSHLDPKKRNKSQLEILREDLPGSVIFSYSGQDMKSSYF